VSLLKQQAYSAAVMRTAAAWYTGSSQKAAARNSAKAASMSPSVALLSPPFGLNTICVKPDRVGTARRAVAMQDGRQGAYVPPARRTHAPNSEHRIGWVQQTICIPSQRKSSQGRFGCAADCVGQELACAQLARTSPERRRSSCQFISPCRLVNM